MKSLKLPLPPTLDCITPAVALGQAIGRLGCFSAGCCYGTDCSLPWAVTFTNPDAQHLSGTPLGMPLHPVQLYTFLGNLPGHGHPAADPPAPALPGPGGGLYLHPGGRRRMVTEIWRGDLDRGFLWGVPWLSTGRLTSSLFILFGCVLMAWWSRSRRAEVAA